MIDQNAKLNDSKHVSISHAGKCCRNTKMSPSQTEEHVRIGEASISLMDEKEKMLNNNEGMVVK